MTAADNIGAMKPGPDPGPGDSPARINDDVMWRLLGYGLTQATIPLNARFKKAIGPLGLTQVEFTVLMLVANNEELVQSELCAAIGVSAPNMTGVLARLFGRSLLARSRSSRDGRKLVLRLTSEGAALAARARQVAEHMEDDLLRRLTPIERTTLFALLRKLARQRRA